MSTRIDRISEEVMKALAEALRSVKDPRVQNAMVSVVHCDVTNDLRYAPELVFELDESITRGAHISEMLHELKNEGKLGGEDEE